MSFIIFALLIISPIISNTQSANSSAMPEMAMSNSSMSGSAMNSSAASDSAMSNNTMTDVAMSNSSMEEGAASNSTSGVNFDPASFPTTALATFAVDIHLTAGNPTQQAIGYHYCSALPNGQLQCDVYDGPSVNSTLVGVELIISNATFANLSANEKIFWHSHAFPILSGLFVLPNLPADQELSVLQSIIDTYGKVIYWQQANTTFPSGAPSLQYGIENNDQINQTLAAEFDRALGLSTTYLQRAQQRQANLTAQPVILGAGNNGNASSYVQFEAQVFNS